VNNSAALRQVARSLLGCDKESSHVDSKQFLEVSHRKLFDWGDGQSASVVHQDVEMPENLDGFLDRLSNFLGIGRVSLDLMLRALPPAFSIAPTTSSALSIAELYVKATGAPSAASRLAIAAPMPREPPVWAEKMG
jgi:hypothetical protein